MKVLWVIVLFSCLPVFLVHGLHYKVCFSTFPHLIWSSLVWSGVIWSGLVLIRTLVSSHSIVSVEGDGGLSRCAYIQSYSTFHRSCWVSHQKPFRASPREIMNCNVSFELWVVVCEPSRMEIRLELDRVSGPHCFSDEAMSPLGNFSTELTRRTLQVLSR